MSTSASAGSGDYFVQITAPCTSGDSSGYGSASCDIAPGTLTGDETIFIYVTQ